MNSHRSILQKLLAILGLAGIILIPLPFVYDDSPLSQFNRGWFRIWQLGLPFFLAVLATLFTIRWIISGRLSKFEGVAGYVAGTFSALVTMSLYPPITPSGVQDWPVLLPLMTLVVGGYVVLENWRKGLPHGLNAWVWLQVAYLANYLLCLEFITEEGWIPWKVGAYLALLTAIVYVIQIILLCRRSGTASSVLAEVERGKPSGKWETGDCPMRYKNPKKVQSQLQRALWRMEGGTLLMRLTALLMALASVLMQKVPAVSTST